MSEWTPGRWAVENWSDKEAQVVAKHCGKKSLICAGVMPRDAHLIVAAPDLAEVARFALEITQDVFDGKVDPVLALDAICDLAKPALAKARGEAQ